MSGGGPRRGDDANKPTNFAALDYYNTISEGLLSAEELKGWYERLRSLYDGGDYSGRGRQDDLHHDDGQRQQDEQHRSRTQFWLPKQTPSTFRLVQSVVHEENLRFLGGEQEQQSGHSFSEVSPELTTLENRVRADTTGSVAAQLAALPVRDSLDHPALGELLPLMDRLLDLCEARRGYYEEVRASSSSGTTRTPPVSPPGDALLPLQWFLCFYAEPDHSCPAHLHFCRQLTFTLGGEGVSNVWRERAAVQGGDDGGKDATSNSKSSANTFNISKRSQAEIYGGTSSSSHVEPPPASQHQKYQQNKSTSNRPAPCWEEELLERRDRIHRPGDVSFLEGEKHAAGKNSKQRISINLFYTTLGDLRRGGVSINGQLSAPCPAWLLDWRELRRGIAELQARRDEHEDIPLHELVHRDELEGAPGRGPTFSSTSSSPAPPPGDHVVIPQEKKRGRWKKS